MEQSEHISKVSGSVNGYHDFGKRVELEYPHRIAVCTFYTIVTLLLAINSMAIMLASTKTTYARILIMTSFMLTQHEASQCPLTWYSMSVRRDENSNEKEPILSTSC